MSKTNYNFECTTTTDFKLKLSTELKNRALKYLQKKLMGIKKLRELNRINIPQNCYNYILITMKGSIIAVEKEVWEDGINILHKEVDKAYFIKENKVWMLDVYIKGLYNEKEK